MEGATICVEAATTTEVNLRTYFNDKNISFNETNRIDQQEVIDLFFAGACDGYTSDSSALAAVRATLASNPSDYKILEEVISKEPLALSVRRGDEDFFSIVKWVIFALDIAEEFDVTSANIDEMKANSTEPGVRRLLGVEGDRGIMLGLENDWAYNAIKEVGNYGEIFDRHLTPLGFERGLNAQWNHEPAGIRYAPPI